MSSIAAGQTATLESSSMEKLAGKYLTFSLGNEEYGIEITKVVEIIKMMEITSVPRTPEYVRGVINLRGKVIPVVELRKKFEMETIEDSAETCIIVVTVETDGVEMQMSILVDTVSEVLNIDGSNIEPAPQFGSDISTDYILGMAKVNEQVKTLVNIGQILNRGELSAVKPLV